MYIYIYISFRLKVRRHLKKIDLTFLELLSQTFATNIHNNLKKYLFYNNFSNPITVIGSKELL